MKKYILAAAAALAMSATGFAQTYYLQVNLNDASEPIEYGFSQMPVATFADDELVIKAETDVEARYKMEAVKNLTIRADYTGVKEVTDGAAALTVFLTSTELTVGGLNESDRLEIYDIAGRMATRVYADAAGQAVASIAGLTPGVYVASTPRHSFKFIKK